MSDIKYNGWYSKYSAGEFGYIEYENEKGETVLVTEITSDDQAPLSKWNDLVYVGDVCKFIKSHKKNDYSSVVDTLFRVHERLQQVNQCASQFNKTNKCFCFLCFKKENIQ